MTDFDRIQTVKKGARARLFAIPGVHAVGIGGKFVGGKRTNEVSIAVFVLKKKALGELPPEQVIPTEIEGIKTDVIEQSPPRLLTDTPTPDGKPYPILRGGIRIKPGGTLGGGGTLGCIAHTNDTPPKIVAITCQHVVGDAQMLPTNVTVTSSGDTVTVTVAAGKATPGTLIVIEFSIPPSPSFRGAYYTTGAADTDAMVASGLQQAISNLALSGVSATVVGSTKVQITITASGGSYKARFYGPHKTDVKSKLHASVANPDIDTHVITLSGRTADGYGVYTNVNPGGAAPTVGVFTAVASKLKLSDVASAIARSLGQAFSDQGLSDVSASATEATVRVKKAESVVCDISTDTRVGQPDNRFGCSTSWCTNNRMGRVIDARADVDVALIQIDGGRKYLAEIQDLGVVAGFYEVTDNDVHPGTSGGPAPKEYPVKIRGAEMGHEEDCSILFLHIDGFIPLDNLSDFGRQYRECMQIVKGSDDFVIGGDSGSALVSNNPPDDGKVVGIVFASGQGIGPFAMATPVQAITAVFKNIGLETATEAQLGVARTVPQSGGANMEMLPEDEMEEASMAGRPSAALRDRLWEVNREISATPVGREYAEAVQRHIPETQDLINRHRRVGAVWQRNGGNQIVASFLEVVQYPDRTLPAAIGGRPITECLRRIQKALVRYGSAGLAADLARLGPLLIRCTDLTYPRMLATLQSTGLE